MKLPKITHLQFLVLAIIERGEIRGQELRDELAARGVKKDGPGFYQLMARLEWDKLVKGTYASRITGPQTIRERYYKLATAGANALKVTREFYEKGNSQ